MLQITAGQAYRYRALRLLFDIQTVRAFGNRGLVAMVKGFALWRGHNVYLNPSRGILSCVKSYRK